MSVKGGPGPLLHSPADVPGGAVTVDRQNQLGQYVLDVATSEVAQQLVP